MTEFDASVLVWYYSLAVTGRGRLAVSHDNDTTARAAQSGEQYTTQIAICHSKTRMIANPKGAKQRVQTDLKVAIMGLNNYLVG